MVDSKFDQYKVDHLFLLVGQNPLPNYVAVKLLLNAGGTIYLIHTSQTEEQAKRLKKVLPDEEYNSIKKLSLGSPASYPQDIAQKIEKHTKKADGLLGLNYTGGNKVMAVHAYRSLLRKDNCIFSYLDSNDLQMWIEKDSILIPFQIPLNVSFNTIFKLHDISLQKPYDCSPLLSELAAVRALGEAKFKDYSTQNNLVDETGNLSLEKLKKLCPHQSDSTLKEWSKSHGKWLESHVLQEVIKISEKLSIHDYGRNFHVDVPNQYRKKDFEFDVAFMRNYQLFAISCTTSSNTEKCKEKLFAAYVRAQQMGGSEARAALVCGSDKPDAFKAELEVSIPIQNIEVFGKSDWPNLSHRFVDWIKKLD